MGGEDGGRLLFWILMLFNAWSIFVCFRKFICHLVAFCTLIVFGVGYFCVFLAPKRSLLEMVPYRWKTKYNVEIVLDACDEILVQILIGRRSPWILGLHHTDQVLGNFINLISCKQIGHLSKTITTTEQVLTDWMTNTFYTIGIKLTSNGHRALSARLWKSIVN